MASGDHVFSPLLRAMSAAAPAGAPVPALAAPRPSGLPADSSRRRRLWELDGHAHCPVLGVCLPMAELRRVMRRAGADADATDDYALHCTAVAQAKQRSGVAEAIHKALEQRFALAVRQAARAKTADALAAWWRDAAAGKDLPGALWATLTHARCTAALETRVLGEVHMLQHQVGMATRVELERFEALIDENAVLARALAAAQQRNQQQADEAARRQQAQDAELLRTRALLIGRDTELAQTRERVAELEAASAHLGERVELARQLRAQIEHGQALQRSLAQLRERVDRLRERADGLGRELAAARRSANDAAAPAPDDATPPTLAACAVLCVGGRTASVPLYRQVIERTGGRFLHHDGGAEDNPLQLEATLAAADLVICQTGCISHDAYWRVKDHCKRTGKACVFVETPSRSALERAVRDAARAATAAPQSTD